MASSVDIANSALTKLGEKRIMSLTDNTKPAREINAVFTLRRDNLLRRYNWNFAIKRASLPALETAPEWGYTYAYQKPSDCLRFVQVNDYHCIPSLSNYIAGADTEPYKIEGQTIATDYSAPLKVRYIRRVSNSGEFDATFVEAFASDLAFVCCEAITGSTSKKESAREDLRMAILDAIRSNAIELPPQDIQDDSWVISRL